MGARWPDPDPRGDRFRRGGGGRVPRNSRPYELTSSGLRAGPDQQPHLSVQLEKVYLTSLAVTLQRFAFMPQFSRGSRPTGVALAAARAPAAASRPARSTRSSTGRSRPARPLESEHRHGGRLRQGLQQRRSARDRLRQPGGVQLPREELAQPTVKSFLPLTLVQPFLRGGGRAVTLEPLTQAERTWSTRSARSPSSARSSSSRPWSGARSRTSAGGPHPRLLGRRQRRPDLGFINVLQDFQDVENDRRNIAAFEQLLTVYRS